MNEALQAIAQAAHALASRLPYAIVISVAETLTQVQVPTWPGTQTALVPHLPSADFRDAAADFLDQWQRVATRISAQTAATALLTAAHALKASRQEQTVEMVWTGPAMRASTFRQTEQALLEVVQLATARLTVVSFAIYRIPRIQEALVAAAQRGVHIRLLVETPHRSEGQSAYNTLRALGERVAAVSTVYYWPQERRPQGEGGHSGLLHVKCAVADGHRMLLSSANLTEYAFTINMELGLLITGGKLPGQVEQHFDRLIAHGTFVKV